MKPPDEVELSREDGEALIERIRKNALTADDRRLLVKLIQLYFWLSFSLQETKIGLKRLKRALFGEGKGNKRPPPDTGGGSGEPPSEGQGSEGDPSAATSGQSQTNSPGSSNPQRRRGHGRQAASVYSQAPTRECCHETLRPDSPVRCVATAPYTDYRPGSRCIFHGKSATHSSANRPLIPR